MLRPSDLGGHLRVWRLVGLVAATLLIAAACKDDQPGPRGDTFPPDIPTIPAVDPETAAKIDELRDDAETAVRVVDAFWGAHWSEFFTGSYSSPSVYGGYFGNQSIV
jgi:hypothetical protein